MEKLVGPPIPKKIKASKRADERAKKIEEAIRLTWDSLQSHLQYTHGQEELMLRDETKPFHKRCVRDYAKVLKILTELY